MKHPYEAHIFHTMNSRGITVTRPETISRAFSSDGSAASPAMGAGIRKRDAGMTCRSAYLPLARW